jgi:hypothetical protein
MKALKHRALVTGGACSRKAGQRACGAPFMMRVVSPVLLFLTWAMVYLSVGLKGMNFCSV